LRRNLVCPTDAAGLDCSQPLLPLGASMMAVSRTVVQRYIGGSFWLSAVAPVCGTSISRTGCHVRALG
jgi:hypothetical protein